MPKKQKKLNELDQLDGKAISAPASQPLDFLLGEAAVSPYKTADEEKYQEMLADMNLTDLQRHAQKVGLAPGADRTTLKSRLLREFRRFILARTPVSLEKLKESSTNRVNGQNLSAASQKILREGA